MSEEVYVNQAQAHTISAHLRGEAGETNIASRGAYVAAAGHGLLAVRLQYENFSRHGSLGRENPLPTSPYVTLLLDGDGKEVHRHE